MNIGLYHEINLKVLIKTAKLLCKALNVLYIKYHA